MNSVSINTREIVSLLRSNINDLEEIALFGSHSCGTQHENSDIDILIKVPKCKIEETLRKSYNLPTYIDIFLANDNEAISISSNFLIKEKTTNDLTKRINPVNLWDASTERVYLDMTIVISDTKQVKLTRGGGG